MQYVFIYSRLDPSIHPQDRLDLSLSFPSMLVVLHKKRGYLDTIIKRPSF